MINHDACTRHWQVELCAQQRHLSSCSRMCYLMLKEAYEVLCADLDAGHQEKQVQQESTADEIELM